MEESLQAQPEHPLTIFPGPDLPEPQTAWVFTKPGSILTLVAQSVSPKSIVYGSILKLLCMPDRSPQTELRI